MEFRLYLFRLADGKGAADVGHAQIPSLQKNGRITASGWISEMLADHRYSNG